VIDTPARGLFPKKVVRYVFQHRSELVRQMNTNTFSRQNQAADFGIVDNSYSHTDSGGGEPQSAAAAGDLAAVGVGLSACHISPLYVFSVALGGEFAFLSSAGTGAPPPAGAGLRGRINSFSHKSRRRLMETVASVDRRAVAVPLFVTLTYPSSFPTDYTVYKKHLDTFLKRLRRAFPNVWAIWRLEFQKRGAPHFHILIFGARYIARGK